MSATADAAEEAGALFRRPWIFIRGVPSMKFLPPEGPPEIAFAGRSNVGKSSLINALFRLVELNSGTITIDGRDISTLGLHQACPTFLCAHFNL